MSVQPTEKPVKGKDKFKPLSREEIARKFGQAYIIMEQDPDLKRWFLDFAKRYNESKGLISEDVFRLELNERPWWVNNSKEYIRDLKSELEFPDVYKQGIKNDVAALRSQATALGAVGFDDKILEDIVKQQRRLGMNQQQTIERLVEFISPEGTDFRGVAGTAQDTLQSWARMNGISLSPSAMQSYIRRVTSGATTVDDVKADLRKTYMTGAYPAWADRIAEGMDPADIAAPYKGKMAALLEIDEDMIDLDDDLLQKAMQGVGADGKPKVTPLYEFQKEIRKDPRWQYTDNARNTYSTMADDVLKMFGFR